MAGRGIYVSVALVLLNLSFCACVTVTFSTKYDSLTRTESNIVYSVMQAMVDNVERDIHLDREYYAGRLFTKYLNLNGKGVVIRLTRWSSECSVSVSQSETSKGSELLQAFKPLLPNIRHYLVDMRSEWAAVSNRTDWIDYYVKYPFIQENEAPLQPADTPTYKILSERSSVTDCAIQPYMLLSHHSTPFLSINCTLETIISLPTPNTSSQFQT